jgi:Uma2 family endonuclease
MSIATSISSAGGFEASVGGDTLAEVVARLGDVPLSRIRSKPAPGTATEQDLILLAEEYDILCELVDGVLVQKPMGYYESRIAQILAHMIEAYLDKHPIGITAGESGPMQTTPGQVRMPDISFVLGTRVTEEMLKSQKVLRLAPDLAVEVLSETNTRKEMSRKLREYFEAGVRLVWYIDPETETAQAFVSPEKFDTISGEQELVGGDLLPGFAVKLSDVFARAKQGMQPPAALPPGAN